MIPICNLLFTTVTQKRKISCRLGNLSQSGSRYQVFFFGCTTFYLRWPRNTYHVSSVPFLFLSWCASSIGEYGSLNNQQHSGALALASNWHTRFDQFTSSGPIGRHWIILSGRCRLISKCSKFNLYVWLCWIVVLEFSIFAAFFHRLKSLLMMFAIWRHWHQEWNMFTCFYGRGSPDGRSPPMRSLFFLFFPRLEPHTHTGFFSVLGESVYAMMMTYFAT